MSIECPKCGSPDVRRISMTYKMGVQNTRSRSIGGGLALSLLGPMIGMGGAVSRGQNTSLLAAQVAPPKRKSPVLRMILWFLGIDVVFYFVMMIGLVITHHHTTPPLLNLFLFLLIFGVPAFQGILAARYNRKVYPEQLAQWDRIFICERCGNQFVPNLDFG